MIRNPLEQIGRMPTEAPFAVLGTLSLSRGAVLASPDFAALAEMPAEAVVPEAAGQAAMFGYMADVLGAPGRPAQPRGEAPAPAGDPLDTRPRQAGIFSKSTGHVEFDNKGRPTIVTTTSKGKVTGSKAVGGIVNKSGGSKKGR